MKRFMYVLAVVAFVGMVTCSAAQADLIQNGSFETATTQTLQGYAQASQLGSFDYVTGYAFSGAGVSNWTCSTSGGQTVWYLADKDVSSKATASAPDGNWVVRLRNNGSLNSDAVLAQGGSGISLTNGTNYTLSFDLWAETSSTASTICARITSDLNAAHMVNLAYGTHQFILNDYAMNRSGFVDHVSTTFTPTRPGTIAYGLQIYTDSAGCDMWLDNVSLTVPEPCMLVLLAMGLIGLLAYAWRKQK